MPKKSKGWKTQQLEKLVRKKTNFTTVSDSMQFTLVYKKKEKRQKNYTALEERNQYVL